MSNDKTDTRPQFDNRIAAVSFISEVRLGNTAARQWRDTPDQSHGYTAQITQLGVRLTHSDPVKFGAVTVPMANIASLTHPPRSE